ncbi:hypothetical protein L9F63_026016, partial [Diploptera punctata]
KKYQNYTYITVREAVFNAEQRLGLRVALFSLLNRFDTLLELKNERFTNMIARTIIYMMYNVRNDCYMVPSSDSSINLHHFLYFKMMMSRHL